jgi:gliding motility-associated lipoprotein GldH
MRAMPMRNICILLLLAVFFQSCDSGMIYDHHYTLAQGGWAATDTVVFEVTVNDTLSPVDVVISVRHGGDYLYANLFLFVGIQSPDGVNLRDTVELVLADPRGKWRGDGFGNLRHYQQMYRKNVRFQVPGIYRFTLEQAMRTNNNELQHVEDVGLRISKSPR